MKLIAKAVSLLTLALCLTLLCSCRESSDHAYQERMKTWTAEKDKQIELLTDAVHRLTQLQTSPQPKFTIVTINGEYYKRIYKIEELSGESWLYFDGETNHSPGWLRLVDLQLAKDAKPPAPLSGYEWILNDPLFQKSKTNSAQ